MKVAGRDVTISHPDRVLFPDDGITKQDLADYYARIGPVMLPHLRDRAISMQRFPDGIGSEGFYQKNVSDHFPEWIRRARIDKEGDGSNEQVVVDDAATLVYLANQGCITPHAWLSRVDRVRHPDRLVFDLDPSGAIDPVEEFGLMRDAARRLRDLLGQLGLATFVMSSGSRGLHVVVPLDRSAEFDPVRAFAHGVAEVLARQHPERLTVQVRKNKRGNRIFIDYLRNAYAQTSVAPYAVRARPGAPVATPLAWDELARHELGPRRYTLRNLFRRLGQRQDPWARIGDAAQSLKGAAEALEKLR